MKITWLFIILLLLSNGCSKNKEILTGDIMGRIVIYNEDYSSPQDRSGVLVSLYKDTALLSTSFTDVRGMYLFENLEYGKYRIDIEKEGYVKTRGNSYIYHVGGYSPTLTDGAIFQIPSFNLTIDSVKVLTSVFEVKFYLKIDGDTLIPYYWYPLIGFCSNSPDVSKDNYLSMAGGLLSQRDFMTPVPAYGSLREFDSEFYALMSDSIYIRLYPLAFGQSYYYPFDKKALGKPSNVVSLKWQ